MTYRCLNWLNKKKKPSPVMVIDLERIKEKYIIYKKNFSGIKPYYAVKANPHEKIIKKLNSLGCYFDCASIGEIENCIKNKVKPYKISFGNTIKKNTDIRKASKLGIKLFACDDQLELEKIAANAPCSKVFIRIRVSNSGSQWPLSEKFGCTLSKVEDLILLSRKLKLKPIGISFHVGSQQKNSNAWKKAIKIASKVFKNVEKKGISLNFLNIGGGFPANYNDGASEISTYAKSIKESISKNFGNKIPKKIISEPGRFLVADAGIIESEVILISKKDFNHSKRWVYIDVGRYNGLAETEGEAIHYQISAKGYEECKKSNVILAGPSCDSHDIIYKKKSCHLPKKLKIGDKIRIHSTGAYTITYGSNFNGIKRIREYILD